LVVLDEMRETQFHQSDVVLLLILIFFPFHPSKSSFLLLERTDEVEARPPLPSHHHSPLNSATRALQRGAIQRFDPMNAKPEACNHHDGVAKPAKKPTVSILQLTVCKSLFVVALDANQKRSQSRLRDVLCQEDILLG
jgi:hypothetical protein